MKSIKVFIALTCFFYLILLVTNQKTQAQSAAFRFIAWGDTKAGTYTLSGLSDQAASLSPNFTIYSGDLEVSGFTTDGMNKWKDAMNGKLTNSTTTNSMQGKTFAVRGNHDNEKYNSAVNWQNYFSYSNTAVKVGAVNYSYMSGKDDLIYSFDYGNSHFVGLDAIGDASTLTSAQITWLDSDLTNAEKRSLNNAFIFFHGPIYCAADHCSCTSRSCSLAASVQNLVQIINKHPIVTATFHSHEHLYNYTYLDSSRIPGLTRPIHHFIAGDAGSGPSTVGCSKTYRYDYCMNEHGFLGVDVDGSNITVRFYKQGNTSPVYTKTFSRETATTVPTNILTITPTSIINVTLTPTKTPTPTKTVTPTIAPACKGGCYGSSYTCSRVACGGKACKRLTVSETITQCGWSTGTAYRCCQ